MTQPRADQERPWAFLLDELKVVWPLTKVMVVGAWMVLSLAALIRIDRKLTTATDTIAGIAGPRASTTGSELSAIQADVGAIRADVNTIQADLRVMKWR